MRRIPAPLAGTIKISKAYALKIQADQIAHYARVYPDLPVAEIVANATTADALADGEHDIVTINRHIPRGGAIEHLIGKLQRNRE